MLLIDNVYITGVGCRCIKTAEGTITNITETPAHPAPGCGNIVQLRFDNAITFPGLINSHDHLDFNLFPMLGNRKYGSYMEWGPDIHTNNKAEIQAVLNIPQALRTQWGVYKNLLNGVTTVVNHGTQLMVNNPQVIRVMQNCQSLHSVGLEKHWQNKLNNPFFTGRKPVIHLGEGTNAMAHREINEFIHANLLRRKTVAVHGVAMDAKQAAKFNALVWCPASNYFLLDRTADIETLKNYTAIVFGTDSTLTGSWNMWEQLRLANALQKVHGNELQNMLTEKPAAVWGLPKHGRLAEGMAADIVVAKQKAAPGDAGVFFAINPEDILLVVQNGQVRLFDEMLYPQLSMTPLLKNDFSSVIINGTRKYVEGNLPGLMEDIRKFHPAINFPVYA